MSAGVSAFEARRQFDDSRRSVWRGLSLIILATPRCPMLLTKCPKLCIVSIQHRTLRDVRSLSRVLHGPLCGKNWGPPGVSAMYEGNIMEMREDELRGRSTASYFADWVFWKTNPGYRRKDSPSTIADRKALGRFAHEQIDNLQFWLKKVEAARGISTFWELVYSDPHDGSDGQVFLASILFVDGSPMRCKPDVVFRDTRSGRIVVVERKVTGHQDKFVPPNAWPNIRAQLWCYAWIDDWVDAPDVTLVCQFYQRRVNWNSGCRQDSRNPWILNYLVRPGWRRQDHPFHSECLKYFCEYGGQFLQSGVEKI